MEGIYKYADSHFSAFSATNPFKSIFNQLTHARQILAQPETFFIVSFAKDLVNCGFSLKDGNNLNIYEGLNKVKTLDVCRANRGFSLRARSLAWPEHWSYNFSGVNGEVRAPRVGGSNPPGPIRRLLAAEERTAFSSTGSALKSLATAENTHPSFEGAVILYQPARCAN